MTVRILLATDLSARCDRALDRAVTLANAWRAELLVLHVLDEGFDASDVERRLPSWRRPIDHRVLIEEQMRRDMLPLDTPFRVLVEKGEPADVILRVAAAQGCDLIVTGIARDETLGRFRFGATVDRLLRGSKAPLLVVRGRARSAYRRVVVATDFSEPSGHALRVALQLFPDQRLTLFHAHDAPFSGLGNDPEKLRAQYGRQAEEEGAAFLQAMEITAAQRTMIDTLVEYGDPRQLVQRYALDNAVDLVVLGTHGRSGLLQVLIGSMATGILATLPCDALVVRSEIRNP